MDAKIITCHDVYNVGASLQAYALSTYLKHQGIQVELIDYKPPYLSHHYSLFGVNNPRYDKPILRELYQILKFPGRLRARLGKRKREFDTFTKQYLPLTEKRFVSNEDLKANLPVADVYFAGSDQIWNTLFMNGKDPAFYLEFAPDDRIKASYAASFATDFIAEGWEDTVRKWLSRLDYISVREQTGVSLAVQLGFPKAVKAMDPVFLLDRKKWEMLEKPLQLPGHYILVYDFDKNPLMENFVKQYASENKLKVYSVLPCGYADRSFDKEGPRGFLTLVHHADLVVSNSFHAVAFSLIYEKQFAVFERLEGINSRMKDLLKDLDMNDRIITERSFSYLREICSYERVREKLEKQIFISKQYIDTVIKGVNE